jgi:branched-chain amino acid transport system substrate-binding protein
MSRVAESDSVGAVFGCAGQVALAIAPVAQQAEIPLVAARSGSDGVLDAGDYVFRATAPQTSYQNLVVDKLAAQGLKSAVVVYQSDNPTPGGLGERVNPDLVAKAGIAPTCGCQKLGARHATC